MPSRHRSRERALQLVFQWDFNRASTEQVKQGYWESLSPDNPPEGDPFAEQLFQGVTARVDEIDSLIRGTFLELETRAHVHRRSQHP